MVEDSARVCGAGCPEDDVEHGRGDGGDEALVCGEATVHGEGGFASGFEVAGELAAGRVGE